MVTSRGIPSAFHEDVNSPEYVAHLSAQSPDLVMSAAYPQIFSADLLSVPSIGAVNFHPSRLPEFRGAHPHYWAIAEGAEIGGITAHYMTEKLDQGDIISQVEFPISELTYDEYYDRIVGETSRLVREVVTFFIEGRREGTPQDRSRASYYRNDREEDHRLRWGEHSVAKLKNLTRTLRAFTEFRGRCLTIISADAGDFSSHGAPEIPGTIVRLEQEGFYVSASDGSLFVREVQDEEGRFPASRWAQQNVVRAGERFS